MDVKEVKMDVKEESTILTLRQMHEARLALFLNSAICYFIYTHKRKLKYTIPDIDNVISNMNSDVKNKNIQMIRSRFIFHDEEYTVRQYTLFQAGAVLNFCRNLVVTEEFLQDDKNALIQIAHMEYVKYC